MTTYFKASLLVSLFLAVNTGAYAEGSAGFCGWNTVNQILPCDQVSSKQQVFLGWFDKGQLVGQDDMGQVVATQEEPTAYCTFTERVSLCSDSSGGF